MNKSISWLKFCLVLCFFAYSLTTYAADINQADPMAQEKIRQQERLNQLRQQQKIKLDVCDVGEPINKPRDIKLMRRQRDLI